MKKCTFLIIISVIGFNLHLKANLLVAPAEAGDAEYVARLIRGGG